MAKGVYQRSADDWTHGPWVCPVCSQTMKAGGKGPHGRVCGKPDKPLWDKVDKNGAGGCWLYMGARDKWGYGDLNRRGKHIQAHRYIWRLLRGEPGDFDVLHSCNNPPCCNPDHLYLGTDLENARDRIKAGTILRGEKLWNAKLTEEKVREIRARRKATGESYQKIADDYGVSGSIVRATCKGEYWSHVK